MKTKITSASWLIIFLFSFVGACASTSPYSATAYEQAVSLKVQSLSLMKKATNSYNSHKEAVERLEDEIDIAYEFAKGRPNNEVSTKQWELLKDPERNLLGGFLARWEKEKELSKGFIMEARGLIADAFDKIIQLESQKIRAEDVK